MPDAKKAPSRPSPARDLVAWECANICQAPWNFIIAMSVTNKLGLVIVVLLLCIAPLAVFSENPGLTPSGCVQLVVIVATMLGALVMFRQKRSIRRVLAVCAAYAVATLVSNLVAMALIPHLIH